MDRARQRAVEQGWLELHAQNPGWLDDSIAQLWFDRHCGGRLATELHETPKLLNQRSID